MQQPRIRRTILLGATLLGLALAAPVRADQPHMEKALKLLRQAKAELEQAKDNKGGHKKNALEALDRAINQTQAGIEHVKNKND